MSRLFFTMARMLRHTCFFLGLLATAFLLPAALIRADDQSTSPYTLHLHIQGTINPAVADYILKNFARAADAVLVIIEMDTPGGLDGSMREIIKAILNSPIPVVTYVSPDGARAASAGTYILYASHIAAMAPATNLGAATPIQIGGIGSPPENPEGTGQQDRKEKAMDSRSTLMRKITNDASAYIRALAEKHGRNADWAEKAVREAVSLSAPEALDLQVINFIARDLNDLLRQIDGFEVEMQEGRKQINTANLALVSREPSWRDKLLGVIADPNIAYLLMLAGFFGLFFEISNPGVLFPGVAGGISLMLAMYAFQILPVNYSGLALILLGLAFLVAEAFLPSFGSLGIGGIVSFAAGSLMLLDDDSLRISRPLIGGLTVAFSVSILLLLGRVAKLRKKKVHTGMEAMIGMTGEARDDFTDTGQIWLFGESWNARSKKAVRKGDRVEVVSIKGLELTVKPVKRNN